MNEQRINARLDEESAKNLEYIRQVTGASTVTDALKFAIGDTASRIRESNSNGEKMKALLASDFIGCAAGPEGLSENYKDELKEQWAKKHGIG